MTGVASEDKLTEQQQLHLLGHLLLILADDLVNLARAGSAPIALVATTEAHFHECTPRVGEAGSGNRGFGQHSKTVDGKRQLVWSEERRCRIRTIPVVSWP